MNDSNVTKACQRRLRYSPEFKAQIVAQCLEPGASVSRIALDNGLNANMVRRWIREARRGTKAPGFVPILPAAVPAPDNPSVSGKRSTIRIEIPRTSGVVVEWPVEQAHQCAALLRELLG